MSCRTHHFACDCRERQFAKIEAESRLLKQRFLELKHASRGTILNKDGDPLYALIPIRLLNDQ